jgi:hypothetical protein
MKFKGKVNEKYLILNVDQRDFKQAIRVVGFDIVKKVIVAMAYSRKDAMRKLEDLHMPITDHLLMVLVMPTSNSVEHWKTELKGWQKALKRYNKAKSRSGRNYSRGDLLKWLWECPFETPSDRAEALKRLREEGYNVPSDLDAESLRKAVDQFIDGILNKRR